MIRLNICILALAVILLVTFLKVFAIERQVGRLESRLQQCEAREAEHWGAIKNAQMRISIPELMAVVNREQREQKQREAGLR